MLEPANECKIKHRLNPDKVVEKAFLSSGRLIKSLHNLEREEGFTSRELANGIIVTFSLPNKKEVRIKLALVEKSALDIRTSLTVSGDDIDHQMQINMKRIRCYYGVEKMPVSISLSIDPNIRFDFEKYRVIRSVSAGPNKKRSNEEIEYRKENLDLYAGIVMKFEKIVENIEMAFSKRKLKFADHVALQEDITEIFRFRVLDAMNFERKRSPQELSNIVQAALRWKKDRINGHGSPKGN